MTKAESDRLAILEQKFGELEVKFDEVRESQIRMEEKLKTLTPQTICARRGVLIGLLTGGMIVAFLWLISLTITILTGSVHVVS